MGRMMVKKRLSAVSTVRRCTGLGFMRSRLVCKRLNNVVLIQWVAAHQNKPYPSNFEKGILARLSKKTLRQTNHWFANVRREIKKTSMEDWINKHPVPSLSSPALLELDSGDVPPNNTSSSLALYSGQNLMEPTLNCSIGDAEQSTTLQHPEIKGPFIQNKIEGEPARIYNVNNPYVSYQPYPGYQSFSNPNFPAEQDYIPGYGPNSFGLMPPYYSPTYQDSSSPTLPIVSPTQPIQPPPLQPILSHLPPVSEEIDHSRPPMPAEAAAFSGYHIYPNSHIDINYNVCVQLAGM